MPNVKKRNVVLRFLRKLEVISLNYWIEKGPKFCKNQKGKLIVLGMRFVYYTIFKHSKRSSSASKDYFSQVFFLIKRALAVTHVQYEKFAIHCGPRASAYCNIWRSFSMNKCNNFEKSLWAGSYVRCLTWVPGEDFSKLLHLGKENHPQRLITPTGSPNANWLFRSLLEHFKVDYISQTAFIS